MQNQANQKMGDGQNVKLPLKECKEFTTEANVTMGRISAPRQDLTGMVRLTPEIITGFDIDYQKNEYKPKDFIILAHVTDKVYFRLPVTEEMLEGMLNYIKAEKNKVYMET